MEKQLEIPFDEYKDKRLTIQFEEEIAENLNTNTKWWTNAEDVEKE